MCRNSWEEAGSLPTSGSGNAEISSTNLVLGRHIASHKAPVSLYPLLVSEQARALEHSDHGQAVVFITLEVYFGSHIRQTRKIHPKS